MRQNNLIPVNDSAFALNDIGYYNVVHRPNSVDGGFLGLQHFLKP